VSKGLDNSGFNNTFGSAASLTRASMSGFAAGVSATLARGGQVNVAQIATDAFGNALGSDLAGSLSQPTAQEEKLDSLGESRQRWLEASVAGPGGRIGEIDPRMLKTSSDINWPRALGGGFEFPDDASGSGAISANAPVATNPADPFGRTISIGGQDYTARQVLTIARDAQVGDADTDAFLNEARTILRGHGFRTGITGTEQSLGPVNAANIDQRTAMIRGDSNTDITQLQRSADVALNTDSQQLSDRYTVFSGNGEISRVMPDGTTRKVTFGFADNASSLAGSMDVSPQEARAKTDWKVYSAAIDAAFATQNVNTLTFSGLWRPDYQTFATYFAASSDAKFDNQDRTQMMNNAKSTAGIGLTTEWTDSHSKGNAIDVSSINGNPVLQNGGVQPPIIDQFSRQLQLAGASKIIQPWMTLGLTNLPPATRTNMNDGFLSNARQPGVETVHQNHLHFSI
jgi:hypothetical protein